MKQICHKQFTRETNDSIKFLLLQSSFLFSTLEHGLGLFKFGHSLCQRRNNFPQNRRSFGASLHLGVPKTLQQLHGFLHWRRQCFYCRRCASSGTGLPCQLYKSLHAWFWHGKVVSTVKADVSQKTNYIFLSSSKPDSIYMNWGWNTLKHSNSKLNKSSWGKIHLSLNQEIATRPSKGISISISMLTPVSSVSQSCCSEKLAFKRSLSSIGAPNVKLGEYVAHRILLQFFTLKVLKAVCIFSTRSLEWPLTSVST